MIAPALPISDHMAVLAESIRTRLLLVLEGQDLTVSELCEVLRLPQSTVSRHLKTLSDGHWIGSRREGTRRLYALRPERLEPSAHQLWEIVREQLGSGGAANEDAARLRRVLAQRSTRSRQFFASAAGNWDLLRDELFGPGFFLGALPALLPRDTVVGDLGCGTGVVAAALAPCVRQVIAVDGSEAMLATARRRLAPHANVELRAGELEALPIEDGRLDVATLVLVLHHLADPARAIAEAARALRPGGHLLVVDMLPHDRVELQEQMGHVWLGFSEEQVRRLLEAAGFGDVRQRPLEPATGDPTLKLFAADAVREAARSKRGESAS